MIDVGIAMVAITVSPAPEGVEVVTEQERPGLWVAAYERFGLEALAGFAVDTPLDVSPERWARDWLADPHVVAAKAVTPLEQPGLGTLPLPALPGLGPWSVPAPALGAHTAEVLAELGL